MKHVPLHEFIALNREEIIRRCRSKVATRTMPPPTEEEINHGVPLFLDQMVDALRLGIRSNPEIGRSAVLHGHELLLKGFTVSQVVQDYGDVCQTVTSLAMEMNAPISTPDFRALNLCLDEAIAGALTEYGFGRDQSTLEGESARGSERLGFLAHQGRNLGFAGNTASVLKRALVSISLTVLPVEGGVIEVLDECAGLPDSSAHDRFRSFEELSSDGTAGVGLAFSRWGAEVNGGKIYARNLPDKGCIFTVDLLRLAAPC
jgi:hypothetical protein